MRCRCKGRGPACNVQAVVDAEHALIVAHAVTAEATDNTSLQPMAEAVREALGQSTLKVGADADHSNGAQAEALEAQGIVPYVPARRAVNNQGDGSLFDRRCFTYDEATDTMRCPAGQGAAAQAATAWQVSRPIRGRRRPLRRLCLAIALHRQLQADRRAASA